MSTASTTGTFFGPTPRDLVRAAIKEEAAKFGVTYEEVVGPCREKRLIPARYAAMTRVRDSFKLSLPQIGAAFGGRDHSTVMYGVRKHRKENPAPPMPSDAEFARIETAGVP